ncbi:MAG: hypothetical protein Q8941_18545 [Bacteroidota bacterium]|nr:hypothetical protein [Bacteroidota bacterium]
MKKEVDLPYAHFSLEDDLLTGVYKKTPRLTLDMAKEAVKARLELTGSQQVLGLIYNEGVKSIDKKARDYFSSEEGTLGIIAAAYIVDSPFKSAIANFFIYASRAKIHVRVFTKKEAALKWLAQYRK